MRTCEAALTCAEFVRRLSEASAGDEVLAAHARECRACAALVSPVTPVPVPPALVSRLHGQLGPNLHPVTPLPGNRALTLGLLAVLALFVSVGVALVGAEGHQELSPLDRILLYGALALSTTGLAVSLPRQVVPGAASSRAHWLVWIGLALFSAVVATRFGHVDLEGQEVEVGLGCLRLGSMWGVAVGVGVGLVLWRGVWGRAVAGALLGLLGGLGALTGLTIYCPLLDVSHVLLWHLAALLPLLALGALVGVLRRG